VVISCFAIGFGFWIAGRKDPPDLHQAASLRITYTIAGSAAPKVLTISDPAEVKAVLSTIHVTQNRRDDLWRTIPGQSVEFILPSGKTVWTQLADDTVLSLPEWGGTLYVTDTFYRRICDILSQAEGGKIDILKPGT
jgi:hypothetical protein